MTDNFEKNRQSRSKALVTSLKDLLKKGHVSTQEEIKSALKDKGFEGVNQSKISRLLRKIGAVKLSTSNGQMTYRLPTENLAPAVQLQLKEMLLEIKHNDTHIVIQTVSGAAGLIAQFLDQQEHEEILGTIAGHNTVLVIPQSPLDIDAILKQINLLLYDRNH